MVDDALDRYAPKSGADRGLAWFLALGVLRRRGHVDAALRPFLSRPLTGLDAPVRATLRVGAFEKLFGRSPDRAVVHQTVEVCKKVGVGRAKGLVNAVMRRVKPTNDLSRSESLDHPAWLVARWTERYGAEATERWCRANAVEPPLFLVGANVQGQPVTLQGQQVPDVWRVDDHEGPITERPGFEEGGFWVQDAASVLVADLVGAKEGMRVLDACAAPGGKSFRMAAQGASVLATDVSKERLALLAASAKRLGLSIEQQAHDGLAAPWSGAFDTVLVDAPCTGLGTTRRHPDIRWRRMEPDIDAAAARQRTILENASAAVRPGGALVYAVCSAEPEEGTEVVEAFLASHPEFEMEQGLSTAPPEADEDAHWAARMRRVSTP